MKDGYAVTGFTLFSVVIAFAFFVTGHDYAFVTNTKTLADAISRSESSTVDNISVACRNTIGQEQINCISREVNNNSAREITELTLQFQERAANMSLMSLWATLLGSGVAGVGIYFVARTLDAQKSGVKDANRAYVHVVNAKVYWGKDPRTIPSVSLGIANDGQTPAKWAEMKCAIKIFKNKDEIKIEDMRSLYEKENPLKWFGIPAKQTVNANALPTEHHQSQALKNCKGQRQVGVAICGKITYETFFGEIFESEFFFRSFISGKPNYGGKEKPDGSYDKDEGRRISKPPASEVISFKKIS